MARRALKLPDIKHIPFRLITQIVLFTVTLVTIGLVGWMLWRIYLKPTEDTPIITTQRTELLQPTVIEELEIYADNPSVGPFPASVFPTTDLSIIPQ